MDNYKGIAKIQILGQERGFKFGTMQAAIFCKEMKCKLADIEPMLDGSDLEAQILWYWAAAVSYSRLFKQDEPTKDDVAAWIDTYGVDNIQGETSKSDDVPNTTAP